VPEPAVKGWMPLNSFCGVNMMSSIRRGYLKNDRPVKFFWGQASDGIFRKALKVTVGAFRAIRSLAKAKLLLVGQPAPGFYDLNVDIKKLSERLGTRIESLAVDSVIERARLISRDDVNGRMAELSKEINFGGVEVDQIERSVRIELALKRICGEEGVDILAVDCWPKFQLDYKVMVCSAIGNLNSSGIVAACEGDIESGLSMFVLSRLAGYPGALMDLATLSEKEDAVCLWHCGPAAVCYADKNGVKLGCTLCKDAYGPGRPATALGPGNYMVLADGDYTVMRFTSNAQKMLTAIGKIRKFDLPYWDGSIGWMTGLELNGEKVSALDFVNTVVVTGFEHHFPLVKGNYFSELSELGVLLGTEQLRPVRYSEYLK